MVEHSLVRLKIGLVKLKISFYGLFCNQFDIKRDYQLLLMIIDVLSLFKFTKFNHR